MPRPLILLVDDDPLIRQLGREFLEHRGFRVATAADSVEALRLFKSLGGVDLVILDYLLPGVDSSGMVRELCALDGKVRVLMASGFMSARELASLKNTEFRG